jgi:hypothetical protein
MAGKVDLRRRKGTLEIRRMKVEATPFNTFMKSRLVPVCAVTTPLFRLEMAFWVHASEAPGVSSRTVSVNTRLQ